MKTGWKNLGHNGNFDGKKKETEQKIICRSAFK